jgi:hypothetical protein
MNCDKCKSPLNLTKARRRYLKKFGREPMKGFLGLCSCGEYVVDKEWFNRDRIEVKY